ncbi:unnamed protein product [Strongylus vulgaris]|uniref:Uncharacterized protein n=1 Tax=Strongylus vulgaris TaxID=40348 RepID=A0A3P7J1K1_STRVU|nr:unnamed protein product [Strongylus vulgaris]
MQKEEDLTRGEKLNRILFTDEKILTVEQLRNAQNQRDLLPRKQRVVKSEKTHFPQSVMVWAGILGLCKTKLVFVQKSRTNLGGYCDRLGQRICKEH